MAPAACHYERARAAFDYFSSAEDGGTAFMENAGGSQVPRCVVNAVSDYFSRHYAQLGAGYARSDRATQTVRDTHTWLELFMNTQGQGQVVVGPSTSQLAFNLASAFVNVLGPADSIVLQEASHESVLGPWVRLAQRTGSEVRWWAADRASGDSPMEGLEAALQPSTRLVVVTHVSNLLGDVLDLAAVVRMVRRRSPAAQVMADGVAYAPHRAIDVCAWGVDWYLWSAYKVYGPHVAVMYGRHEAYGALLERGGGGPNHYFVPASELTYAFELGGASHEGCAGLLALQDYLLHLLGHQQQQQHQQGQPQQLGQQQQQPLLPQHPPAEQPPHGEPGSNPQSPVGPVAAAATASPPPAAPPPPSSPPSSPPPPPPPLLRGVTVSRAQVEEAFALMTAMEQPLQEQLLSYLSSHPAVCLLGAADPDPAGRVPTISFVHRAKSCPRVVSELQAAGFAVRCGHMYARRLVEALAADGGLLATAAAARQGGEERQGGAAGGGGGGAAAAVSDRQRLVEDGVVRVSLLHYNTPEEVARLIETMQRVL